MADQTLRQAGIYRITHVPSGLVYIGSSLDMHRRWRQHQIHLQSRKHDSKRLQAAWIDDGPSAFTIAVLEAIPGLGRTEADKGRLFAIEQAWLDKISPFLPAVGFNILPFAGSPGLSNHTPEARAKLSAATKRRYLSPEARAETAAAATNPSLETRTKMSAAATNRSDEWRAKMSAAYKNRTDDWQARATAAWTGQKHSAETRARMSVAARSRSAEARANAAAAQRGKKVSPETKAKMSAAHKGRRMSPEAIAKRVASRAANRAAAVTRSASKQ